MRPFDNRLQETLEVNFNELLTSGPYKEAYRKDMIEWGESVRDRDPGYFCRSVSSLIASGTPMKLAFHNNPICSLVEGDARDGDHDVFIIPDCRRPTDLEYFSKRSLVKVAVRVNASEEVRRQRGWAFTRGVDDAASECALDSYPKFDVIINNNDPNVRELLQPVRTIQSQLTARFRSSSG